MSKHRLQEFDAPAHDCKEWRSFHFEHHLCTACDSCCSATSMWMRVGQMEHESVYYHPEVGHLRFGHFACGITVRCTTLNPDVRRKARRHAPLTCGFCLTLLTDISRCTLSRTLQSRQHRRNRFPSQSLKQYRQKLRRLA